MNDPVWVLRIIISLSDGLWKAGDCTGPERIKITFLILITNAAEFVIFRYLSAC